MYLITLLSIFICSSFVNCEDPTLSGVQLVSTSKMINAYWQVSGPTDNISQFQIILLNKATNYETGFLAEKEARSFLWNDLEAGTNYEVCVYIMLTTSPHKNGSCSSIDTTLHDPMVSNLTLEMEGIDVKVTWDLSLGSDEDVGGYLVTWSPPHNGGSGYSVEAAKEYIIEKVHDQTEYEVCVEVESPMGILLSSSCKSITPVSDIFIVDLQFNAKSHEITATWGVQGSTSGTVQPTFTIDWKSSQGGSSSGESSIPTYIMRNLEANSDYTVCVQGHDGTELVTLIHCDTTQTAVADPTIDIFQIVSSSTAIGVYWSIDGDVNSLQRFLVTWGPNTDDIEGSTYTSNTQDRSLVLFNLQPKTKYTVCVSGHKISDTFTEKTCREITTEEYDPDVELLTGIPSNTSILLNWAVTSTTDLSKVSNFMVTWVPTGNSGSGFTPDSYTFEYSILELSPETDYEVCVEPMTVTGILMKKECERVKTQ